MILQIALLFAPFFAKFSLWLVDKFIKGEADKAAAKKAVLQSAHDYNVSASESANLRGQYREMIQAYLDYQKANSDTQKPN